MQASFSFDNIDMNGRARGSVQWQDDLVSHSHGVSRIQIHCEMYGCHAGC